MRLHRMLTAALAALGLSACELEPGDPIYLSGRALEADGAPWRSGALPLLRQLPYEAVLANAFREWEKLSEDGIYKVMQAERPRRT